MSAWLKRFGLHLAAAVGATGLFVAAAAVGATQTRQQVASVATAPVAILRTREPGAQRKPSVVVEMPTPSAAGTPNNSGAEAGVPTAAQSAPSQVAAGLPPNADPTQTRPAAPQAQPAPGQSQPAPIQTQPPASAAGNPAAVGTPSPRPTPRRTPTPGPSPAPTKVVPERSLAGTVQEVQPDALEVLGVGGRTWRVTPVPGALIRLNGRAAVLDTLQVGDTVVILGQAQTNQGPGNHFLAHAITARRK